MNNGPFGGNAGVGGAGGATFAQPDVFGVNGAGGLAGAATPQATRVIIIRNVSFQFKFQFVLIYDLLFSFQAIIPGKLSVTVFETSEKSTLLI